MAFGWFGESYLPLRYIVQMHRSEVVSLVCISTGPCLGYLTQSGSLQPSKKPRAAALGGFVDKLAIAFQQLGQPVAVKMVLLGTLLEQLQIQGVVKTCIHQGL